jgi:proliferating cell nuclear antigen
MLEATLEQGSLIKKLIEAIKDLVSDANWDCNESGIALQAMDSAHVALVSLLLRSDGFEPYRCDRNLTLGLNVGTMAKVLKCAGMDDKITLKANDNGDTLTFIFNGSKFHV